MALIDREYAKDAVKYIPWCDWMAVGECLDACPTIDPESLRQKGEWIEGLGGKYVCSRCGEIFKNFYMENFCPNCGCDMRGESE